MQLLEIQLTAANSVEQNRRGGGETRSKVETRIGTQMNRHNVVNIMLRDKTRWNIINEFVRNIIEQREEDEKLEHTRNI